MIQVNPAAPMTDRLRKDIAICRHDSRYKAFGMNDPDVMRGWKDYASGAIIDENWSFRRKYGFRYESLESVNR